MSESKTIRKAPNWTTKLFYLPLVATSTAFFGSISLLCSLWDKSGQQQHSIAQAWARSILRIGHAPMSVLTPDGKDGRAKLASIGTAVYCSNHLSYMDTPALFGTLPFQFRILANSYLFKIPFIGWHLNRSGQIPIDQSNMRSQIAGLNKGIAALKSGMPILLFPDGGRASDGHIRQFLSGAAFMALKAQVPLVPLALIGTHQLLPMHDYSLHPHPLKLIVGDPLITKGRSSKEAEALTQELHDSITAMYYHHGELSKP